MLRVFVVTGHDGHWPVGSASVIVARDRRQADKLLAAELERNGLDPRILGEMQEVKLTEPYVRILVDGNY